MTQSDASVIEVDQFLRHPPDAVWEALTCPDMLSRWFMPTDFEPIVGRRFTFRAAPVPATGFAGVVLGQVLEVRPKTVLSYSWADAADPRGLSSVVTWTVTPEGRLRPGRPGPAASPDHPQRRMAHTGHARAGGFSDSVTASVR